MVTQNTCSSCPGPMTPTMNEVGQGNALAFALILRERLSPTQLNLLENVIPVSELQKLVFTLTISGIETYQDFTADKTAV